MPEETRKPGDTGDNNPASANASAADTGSVTLSAAELDDLRKRAAERDEYLDLARRTQAEFQNFQKRNQRDREQERQYFAGSFVLDLLPVLDNLERATNAANEAGEKSPLVQGVNLVQTQFVELLKKFGVTPIKALGEMFDPNLHEALTQQPSPEPANTVIHVVDTGYKIHDRVLRPSRVVVSSGPAEG